VSTTWSGGEAVARSLAAHGVDLVWGIPGTHNLAIYAALPAAGIRHVLPRHEQGAAFAADGYARVSGRPGVCVTTSGPAVLNAATALGQAYSDSIPVLLVSAGMPVDHPAGGNGELHETRDLGAAMRGVIGTSRRVTSVAEIPEAIAEAFAAMASGRPRPQHVEVPLDLLDARAETEPRGPRVGATAAPEPDAVAAAAQLLAGARRPAIVAGGGARGAADPLRRLAERVGAPVLTTFNGKGTLPEDHPLSVGAGLHREAAHALMADSDVLLVAGSELAPADLWTGPLPAGPAIVRVDVEPEQVAVNADPEVAIVADAGAALAAVAERLGPGEPADPARAASWHERLWAEGRQLGERWGWLLDGIEAALGREGVLAGDSAMVCYLGAVARLRRYEPGSFLYPTGFGTLGYGLPAAIGAKLAAPDRRVLALMGDGGVMFTLPELAAAAALRIALPVVVVDNGGYGEIRNEMLERGDEPLAVDLPELDFPAVARGLGCEGVRVEDEDALERELERAFAAARPTLLHVPGA
jgi:acetolactate synthase-1/2/3 large subunit